MVRVLEARRHATAKRLDELRSKLSHAAEIASEKACVYLTGSFARGEATQHSDLDLFIAGRFRERPALSRLDEICIKADLIDATRQLKIPDFSGDGAYLVHYTVKELVRTLGKPHDDASNTFTARLLLLLESKPLLGDEIYKEAVGEVVASYWRDYADHKGNFMPAFLANDILRLWRTFCVNYEARTDRNPNEKKAKGKLKNFKLKHSRLLTCYSAMVYLLATFVDRKTVTPDDAMHMTAMTPTERLEWLASRMPSSQEIVSRILSSYENFLNETDAPEEEMIRRFMDKNTPQEYYALANELGDGVFDLLRSVGDGSSFFRLLVV